MKKIFITLSALALMLALSGCVSWFDTESTAPTYHEPASHSAPVNSSSSYERRSYHRGSPQYRGNQAPARHSQSTSRSSSAPAAASTSPQSKRYSCFVKSSGGAFHASGSSQGAASSAAMAKCRASGSSSCALSKCISR